MKYESRKVKLIGKKIIIAKSDNDEIIKYHALEFENSWFNKGDMIINENGFSLKLLDCFELKQGTIQGRITNFVLPSNDIPGVYIVSENDWNNVELMTDFIISVLTNKNFKYKKCLHSSKDRTAAF